MLRTFRFSSRRFTGYDPRRTGQQDFRFTEQGTCTTEVVVEGQTYRFPVSLEDLGTATLLAEHKAITLMRYIRKALEEHTFVKC